MNNIKFVGYSNTGWPNRENEKYSDVTVENTENGKPFIGSKKSFHIHGEINIKENNPVKLYLWICLIRYELE